MKVRDSHIGRSAKDGCTTIIERLDYVTRWEELKEVVAFHAKWAARCWIPTKYWLVNDPAGGGAAASQKFGLCWSAREDVPSEMNHIRHVMKDMALDQSQCPLASRIHSLAKGIAKEAPALMARNRHVTLVICTQGLPMDKHGVTTSNLRREFQRELASFGKLPVKVIIRLTTDDERVRDMFNTMDSKFDSIDVLDDYWGEAMEVYLYNPWLTYGMGLHRLREAGLAPEVMDDLDERPLTLDELYEFCKMLFVGDDDLINLPHPKKSWNNFFRSLNVLVEKEKLQWNPVKRKSMPWINLSKLESKYEHYGQSSHAHHLHHGGYPQSQARSEPYHYQRSTSNRSQEPERSSSNNSQEPQRSSSNHSQEAPRQQQQSRPSSKSSPGPPPPRKHGHTAAAGNKNLTLKEVLKRWSHQPSDYKTSYPLGHLLVTVPQTFPPTNNKVEPHEYFAKWKEIDKEAFADEKGDDLKELLKRATRKAKFFLHPDKLPKDLTENQTLLLKTIWDVLQDREAAILG